MIDEAKGEKLGGSSKSNLNCLLEISYSSVSVSHKRHTSLQIVVDL